MSEKKQNLNEGHRSRLKKRFLENGKDALADHELLELILYYARPRVDTKNIAKELLNEYGSLDKLISTPALDLIKEKGIGESTAVLFKLIHETRIYLEEEKIKNKKSISGPKDLIPLMQAMAQNLQKEVFIIFALDSQNQVLGHKTYEGTVDQAVVYTREIVEYCLLKKAIRVIAVHNHPSGIAKPSGADHLVTQRIKEALKLMDMILLDHIIIAGDSYYSFQENSQL